jgi:hypothetical protein
VLALALGSAVAGCTFDPSGQTGSGTPDGAIEPRPDADPLRPDARPIDASAGAPDAADPPDAPAERCNEWTPRPTHFDPCDLPAPSAALDLDLLGEYVYDTDQGTLRNPFNVAIEHASIELPGDPGVRAISVEGLRIGGVTRLRAVGSKPLLVASWSEIVVAGTIDVSSNSQSGAGASTGVCDAPDEGSQSNEGGGGGGGGGFQGKGGKGGKGAGGSNGGSEGNNVSRPATVRGGCAGARGGLGNSIGGPDGRGDGGAGGGALQLTARERIDIQGVLHAGGAGGQGGNCPQGNRSGAGGGGSGGLLDLEAPTITFDSSARLAANGGGGGEGCEGANGDTGSNGETNDQRATGGSGGSTVGGDGGDGSAGSNVDGTDGIDGTPSGADRGSGGGGGGGAGYIILDGNSTLGGALVSPPPVNR